MREIKFRGKFYNRWWYATPESDSWEQFWVVVDDETICQYTGLHDKNGVEIYEGDIVKANRKIYEVRWGKGIVDASDYEEFCVTVLGYYLANKRYDSAVSVGAGGWEDYPPSIAEVEDIEVIGDIYENPEPLESDA